MTDYTELARRLRETLKNEYFSGESTMVAKEDVHRAAEILEAMGQQEPIYAYEWDTYAGGVRRSFSPSPWNGSGPARTLRLYLHPQPAQPQERGPWQVDQWSDGRIVVQSDDFTHDVALVVTGDFADIEQRRAYAHMIASRLNAQPQEQREPTEAQIEAAARRMCQTKADGIPSVTFHYLWAEAKDGFIAEAREVLRAALAAKDER